VMEEKVNHVRWESTSKGLNKEEGQEGNNLTKGYLRRGGKCQPAHKNRLFFGGLDGCLQKMAKQTQEGTLKGSAVQASMKSGGTPYRCLVPRGKNEREVNKKGP